MSRPFIPAPNCASIELIYTNAGSTIENVLKVQKGAPYTLADLQALRGIVDNWDNTSWKTIRPSTTVLNRIRTRALDTNSSPTEDYNLPAPRAGAIAGTPYPPNATWAVKLATGHQGRSFRGRLYFPGLTSAFQGTDANHIALGSANAVLTSLNLLLTQLATGGHTLGVLSYSNNKAFRTTALFTPATSWVAVDLNFDSQRRRLAGRGI